MTRSSLSISLLYCFWFFVFNTGILNSVYAAQNSSNKIIQNSPAQISGKVLEVIISSGVTYVEVNAGVKKVWAAAVGTTPVKKGDTISFSTEMPMQNYHSKNLDRDFAVIYFVKQFTSGDEGSGTTLLPEIVNRKSSIKPEVAKFLADSREVKAGGYLREATLDGLQGNPKKFSDFKGRPLIINVWASWCGPCRAEMGSLERLANRYNGQQLNIIGISTDDYRDRALGLIRQTGITFENFIDHKLMLEKMLGAYSIPLTILVDDKGRVLKKIRGAREWDSPEMIEAIGQVFKIELKQ